MFPPAGASVYYNEAGEPLGWDSPVKQSSTCLDDPGGLFRLLPNPATLGPQT